MNTTKRLPLVLDECDYRRLAAIAAAQDRDPSQQARFIIRQALETDSHELIPGTCMPGPETLPRLGCDESFEEKE
jgi:hypothetical protein